MPLENEEIERAGATVPGISLYKNASVHGADPATEAVRWLDAEFGPRPLPPLLIVIGLAEGHLLDAVERRAPGTRVLAIEPDASAGSSLLAQPALDSWRSSGRLAYLTAPGYRGADDAWRLFPSQADGFRMIVHPRLTEGAASVEALRLVKKIVFGVRANAEARRKFAPRYLLNVVRNIPAIVDGRDVRTLAGRYTGVPAIITAAGPSLDASIGPLADLHSRGLVIATDTTLRPLLGAGIVPHLAVGADPGQANARHFQELPECRRTWLVAESALDATATAAFAGRTLWFRLANHHPWPWLAQHGIETAHLEMWGSVLTAAFQVACLAGCDPIVIVGADLSFTGNRPYCRGTTYEFDWAYGAAMGVELEESWRRQMSRSQLHTVPDLRGRDTTTTGALQSFRDWMIARARRSGRRVINATEAGILYGDGIVQMALADALADDHRVPHIDLTTVAGTALPSRGVVARQLRELEQGLESGDRLAPPLSQWREFSGEGFDSGRLRDAIGASATALESKPGQPRAEAVIPWRTSPAAASILPRLAESIAQPRHGTPDAACLADALRILDRICGVALDLEPLAIVPEAATRGAVSLALLYAWPEHLRWAIQLFEASIGAAAEQPGGMGSFFAGPDAQSHGSVERMPSEVTPARLCLLLAIEWTRRAAVVGAGSVGEADALLSRLRGIDQVISSRGLGGSASTTLTWTFEHSVAPDGGTSASASLRLPVAPEALARAFTGCVLIGGENASLGRFAASTASVDVRAGAGSTARGAANVLVTPRVLTDEGVARSLVAYAREEGVVCVTPYTRRSFLVGADGTVRPHLEWPRPIVGELPFGEGGAVAWDNGMSAPGSSGCVMYRRCANDAAIVQEISLRPAIAWWWRDRLYFNCYPTPLDTWVGLASWAPGSDAHQEVQGLTLFGMLEDANGLRLEPCVFRSNAGYDRQIGREGWVWQPGRELRPTVLGTLGQTSCQAASGEWVVAVHPQSDLLRFESPAGETCSVRCHFPLRAAWVGGSLLVSTGDREVLLFSGLADTLSHLARERAQALTLEQQTPAALAIAPRGVQHADLERRRRVS